MLQTHLLQVQCKDVLFPCKTFWIAESPSTVVEHRFCIAVVLIIIHLGKRDISGGSHLKELPSHQHLREQGHSSPLGQGGPQERR